MPHCCFFCLFPRGPNPSKVLQQLLVLQPEQLLSIFNTLRNHLRENGMLPPAVEEAQWQLSPAHILLHSVNIHPWLWWHEHTPNWPQDRSVRESDARCKPNSHFQHIRNSPNEGAKWSQGGDTVLLTSEVFLPTAMQNKRFKHMVSECIALQEGGFWGGTSLFWFCDSGLVCKINNSWWWI